MSFFNYEPKSESELVDLLEEGDADYQVIKAEEKISKNGNPMIVLTLMVWDKNGKKKLITDYLILNKDNNFCMRKIRHFCYSCGMVEEYNKGGWGAIECLNKAGKLILKIDEERKDPETGKIYLPKNSVLDYINMEGLEDSMEALKHRQALREQGNPPISAYEDIPL